MSDVTMYHNPRCSKSRETLKLLQDKGIEPTIVEYLKTPPDAATIRKILGMLGIDAIDLVRTKEKRFKELGLSKESDPGTLIEAMAANPVLIERPVVIKDGTARLGRPPESVLEII